MDRIDALLLQSKILLDRQYLLLNRLEATQRQSLAILEKAIESNDQNVLHVLDVYNYVFALIDHLARYQKTAHSIPKLNKKCPEYRSLDDSLGEIKEIRNQIQHLNKSIENENSGPLLGSVSWVREATHYMVVFHDLARERSAHSIVYDNLSEKFVNEFIYNYNEIYHDLGKAISGVHTFQKFADAKIKIGFGEEEYAAEKHFAAFKFNISTVPPQSSG